MIFSTQSMWSSNTTGDGAKVCFQEDGNLVIYSEDGTPIQSTYTYRNRGFALYLRNDGCFQIVNKSDKVLFEGGKGKPPGLYGDTGRAQCP